MNHIGQIVAEETTADLLVEQISHDDVIADQPIHDPGLVHAGEALLLETIVSGRARWQVRFATSLRQLKKEKYIKQDENPGIYEEGRVSRRDAYSITDFGKSLVDDYKLFIGYKRCYLARRNDKARIPEPIPEEELPRELRSRSSGQRAS